MKTILRLAVLALAIGTTAAFAAPNARAAKLCEAGIFVVEDGRKTVLPSSDPAVPEIMNVAAEAFSIGSDCPASKLRLKKRGKRTKLKAKWKKGTCEGIPKKAVLKATFSKSCKTLKGKLKIKTRNKKRKRKFVARRLPALKSFGAPSLVPSLEESGQLTRTLGPDGGDAVTWDADGTEYRLRVPAEALAEPTAITLTPVVSIGGLPLEGGLLHALDLQPAGLGFATPATLTITPAEPLADAGLAGFGWSGGTNAFAISPWQVADDLRSVSIEVPHFSGYGMGIPGPSQLDAVAGEVATSAAAADARFVLIRSCLLGDCTLEEIVELARQWYDEIVLPRVEAAEGPVSTLAAHEVYERWRSTARLIARLTLTTELDTRILGGRARDLANLDREYDRHTLPMCSGDVSDWRDWLRIPEALAEAAEIAIDPLDYCVALEFTDVSFPDTLGDDDTELPLSFRTVVREFDGDTTPIAVPVELRYGSGTSGPESLATESDGSASTEIERILPLPRVYAEFRASAPIRPDVLSTWSFVSIGAENFYFFANVQPDPRPIVPTGGAHEVCVVSELEPLVGQQVTFALEGPGSLSSTTATTVEGGGIGEACIDYQAPAGPVGRHLAATVTATMTLDGETHVDTLEVYPHWVDVFLQADVGAGMVNATNGTLGIPGDGPYAIEMRVEEAGETTADPPRPLGDTVFVRTDEATLATAGESCCGEILLGGTDENGRYSFTWQANGNEASDYSIEALQGEPGESFAAAGVTLERAAWQLTASFPEEIDPDTAERLTVTITDATGSPVPGAWIEVDVSSGSVLSAAGETDADGVFETDARIDAGANTLTLSIRASAVPGGTALASDTVEATAAGVQTGIFFVERFDQVRVTLGSEFSDVGRPGAGSQSVRIDRDEGASRAVGNLNSWVFNDDAGVTLGEGLEIGGSASAFAQGAGTVDEVVFRIVFDVIGEKAPYEVGYFAGVSEGDARWEATLREESSGFEVEGCSDAECPERTDIDRDGELDPGRYIFEGRIDASSGQGSFQALMRVGEVRLVPR